jgi:hypothetical protein
LLVVRSRRTFVQMPAVAWPRATPAQPSGDRSELQHPTSHCFVGEVEPTLGEQILHVAVAQREAEIEPNRVLDNRRRKAVAAMTRGYPIRRSRSPRFRDMARCSDAPRRSG